MLMLSNLNGNSMCARSFFAPAYVEYAICRQHIYHVFCVLTVIAVWCVVLCVLSSKLSLVTLLSDIADVFYTG